MDAGSSRAVVEVFVQLYEEGLLYRANRLINWCPDCRTALSDLEVEHEERQGSIWEIRYPVKGQDRFLTVATTRPETMLGDTAVAVHPDDPRYRDLIGKTVILPLLEREIPVIADATLVDPEFGTGVVKVTPAHDFNDYQTGLRHGLPMISVLDEAARTNETAGPYAGLDRFEARTNACSRTSRPRGLLVSEKPHTLSIGLCQRSGTIVEPRLSPQWFVKIEPLATPAIEAVEQGRTRIVPETLERHLLPLDAQHPGLVREPPAVVGPPDPRLVLRGLHAADCVRCARSGEGHPHRARTRPESVSDLRGLGADPGPRRARHLVQLGALAVQHPRLAGADAGAARPSTRPRSSRPGTTSSSSGWPG